MNVSVGRGVVLAHGGSRRVCGSCLMFSVSLVYGYKKEACHLRHASFYID